MKTAAYFGKLTSAGVDPKIAQTHGEALEDALAASYVTRDCLDQRLTALEERLRATMYQAMFVPGLAIIGLTAGLVKFLK
jgi:hypothetical protein